MKTAYSEKQRVSLEIDPNNGRTKQSHKNESDINLIMAKYIKTGVIEHGRKHAPRYGFATAMDFHSAMNTITEATEMFADLPSKLRARFENDPAKFLAYCEDPDAAAALLKEGDDMSKPPWKQDPQPPKSKPEEDEKTKTADKPSRS